ncbi:MAG: hypothetical protein OXG04_09375 [Acidobacteria bacterium]|nr:hypothetical protein [Acidobacteriota bacterium]
MEIRYRRIHFSLRFMLLLFATASATDFLDVYLVGRWEAAPELVFAGLVIWDFVADYATKIAVLNSAKRGCGPLEARWRELWQDTESHRLPDDEIRRRNSELLNELKHATAAMDTIVGTVEKVNVLSTTNAYKVMEDSYAR